MQKNTQVMTCMLKCTFYFHLMSDPDGINKSEMVKRNHESLWSLTQRKHPLQCLGPRWCFPQHQTQQF